MTRRILSLLIIMLAISLSAVNSTSKSIPFEPQTPQGGDKKAEQQAALEEIKKRIAGHENEPAEQVFKNIEVLKGKAASRLPGMMAALVGLLGVDCSYCHVPDQWDKEDKPAKQVARLHFQMIGQMNKQFFKGENMITCWTCHRGKPKPEK